MLRRRETPINKHLKRLRSSWQTYFLPAVALYSTALLHLFYVRPSIKISMLPYLKNLDMASFAIAIGLTVFIFRLKRQYVSSRYFRQQLAEALAADPQADDAMLISALFKSLRKRFTHIWLLALLVVLTGVAFYWLTFSPQNTVHIYFIIGCFSLALNYPREDIFAALPLWIEETRRDAAPLEDESSS